MGKNSTLTIVNLVLIIIIIICLVYIYNIVMEHEVILRPIIDAFDNWICGFYF